MATYIAFSATIRPCCALWTHRWKPYPLFDGLLPSPSGKGSKSIIELHLAMKTLWASIIAAARFHANEPMR